MAIDRDLLEALFAQQLGLAPAGEVMSAGAEWLVQREKGEGLLKVMQARGLLDAQKARLVTALVDEALAAHGGRVGDTLESLPPALQDSLTGFSDTLRSGEHPAPAPSLDSLETPENIGVEARGRYTFDTGRKGRTEELGRGGAGRVVVARDHFLGRDVAWKELHRDVTQGTDTLQLQHLEARFLREARVTGQLEHPSVVPVYELGRRHDGTLYYTMRRVRGRTLAQALGDTGSLEGRLAFVPDLLAACRAVAAAHHRAVIHRDLKPQNVMLGPHGETYVMDWGLARVIGRRERTEAPVLLAPDLTGGRDLGPVGTPSYMSPEQAQGDREQLDERSDVWGLGAMLFEILTGRAPYVGRSPWEVLAEVRTTPPPAVHTLAPTAPPELAAVCDKALAWRREGRYPNAQALADELEAWLLGRRVGAYEEPTWVLAKKVVHRHRWKAVVAGVTALVLLALAGWSSLRLRQELGAARAMSRFFLAEVAPALAEVPGTGEVLEQLSHSALDTFSGAVDPVTGRREDRLLLARTWLALAYQAWRQGRHDAAGTALGAAQRLLEPLGAQEPGNAEVRALALEREVRALDLVVDPAQETAVLAQTEAVVARATAAASAAPQSLPLAQVRALALSRLAVVRFNRGDTQAGAELVREAHTSALVAHRLDPSHLGASTALLDADVLLGQVLLSVGRRDEAEAALRQGAERAQTLRARRDAPGLLDGHAALAMEYVFAIDRHAQPERFARSVETARRLQDELLAAGHSSGYHLSLRVELLLLSGDLEGAWRVAERLDALPAHTEYDVAVVEAAFATGRDALVRARAARPAQGAEATTAYYATLVAALDGDARAARRHLRQCQALRCAETVLWLPELLERRLEGRQGPLVDALRSLAGATRVPVGDVATIQGALDRLDAALAAQEAPR